MGGGSFRQSEILCPFYRTDDGKKRISCEGAGNSSSLTSYYRGSRDFKKQMEVFCCRYYSRCELARAISEKYGDIDEWTARNNGGEKLCRTGTRSRPNT